MSAKVALISAFIALQVADVLTTQHVLAFGGFEANPLGAWAMDHCGAWWPLAKLAPMALVAVVMMRWPSPRSPLWRLWWPVTPCRGTIRSLLG